MKFIFIKSQEKEEVIVYAKKKDGLVLSIENLCNQDNKITGYQEGIIKELNPYDIECFTTSNDKVYAITKNAKYQVKKRLYELENIIDDTFIYINQGCLANINLIDRFDASIGGTLLIIFKSGYILKWFSSIWQKANNIRCYFLHCKLYNILYKY